ncbi:DUF7424 family protein [Providencia rustigianii]|uniref:DUF7424 family protein n=2 Tax=Providencia rustigianii TaxID=158850 RepID=UPI002240ACD7|nr:hypothetical protein [Providencia rustigianii]
MNKIFTTLIITTLLAGCKVDLTTKINTDDLLSTEHKSVAGLIRVEVPSCNDFEDSRKDSNSLTDLKMKIPTVFRGAEFKECYKQKLSSYADFVIPIGVGYMDGDFKPVDTDIYIFSTNDVYAGVILNKDAAARIKSAKKGLPDDMKLELTLIIEKGQKPIPNIAALGVYMTGLETNNSPIISRRVVIEGKEVKFKLSDVSNSELSEGKAIPVLVKVDYIKKLVGNLEMP